jgi:hypothetical protein
MAPFLGFRFVTFVEFVAGGNEHRQEITHFRDLKALPLE